MEFRLSSSDERVLIPISDRPSEGGAEEPEKGFPIPTTIRRRPMGTSKPQSTFFSFFFFFLDLEKLKKTKKKTKKNP